MYIYTYISSGMPTDDILATKSLDSNKSASASTDSELKIEKKDEDSITRPG
jgi:hypothetical protein